MEKKTKAKDRVPIIYLYLYKKFLEKNSTHLRTNLILEVLRRNLYHISKKIHYEILEEMEEQGLIKKVNKRVYQINKIDTSYLQKISNLF